MKKNSLLALIVLFIVLFSSINVYAVTDYNEYADSLFDLGVFLGTENGFELDRAPTRVEGIVMLIRLLGAEEDAKTMSDLKIPFTDVPDWAKGYVAYAYEEGLTKGISDTKFGSNNTLEAKAYITFLLRSLGYDDSEGDFTYINALNYALKLGLIDTDMYGTLASSTFLRSHVAKTSYDTLKFPYKGKDALLIDILIVDGKVDENIGNKFKEKIISETIKQEKDTAEVAENVKSIVMLSCSVPEGTSQGSGVIISSDGEIITNYHVIKGAKEITVYFNDGSVYSEDVYIQDYDENLDLAVIKVDKTDLESVDIGDSKTLKLGESVVAIGSPYGYFNTVTEGIISAIRQNDIQISAAIGSGSSGGGLFNKNGELIGIVYAKFTESENMGFAIPVNLLEEVSDKDLILVDIFGNNTTSYENELYPPNNIRIVDETDNTVYINWDPVLNADYYYFYYQVDGESSYWYDEDNDSKIKFYYDDEYSAEYYDLENGIRYNIIVTSVKDGIESSDSQVFSFVKGEEETYSIYYDAHNGVPDFGKITNCEPYIALDNSYTYNILDVEPDDLELYSSYLLSNGFYYSNNFYDESGNEVLVFSNKSLGKEVMFGLSQLADTTVFIVVIYDI